MRHRVARLCGLSALLVAPLVAQNNARLTGLVLDPAGAAVPSAEVKLSLAGSAQVVYRTITNERGAFLVAGLLPQSYDMTVEARGFALYRLTGIKVGPFQERSVPPISLELASVTAEVTVSADSETVQTGNTEISTTITREQVRYLPIVARRAMTLVATQAGTARAGSVINGARVSYTNITLDGINIQDQFLMISDISALQGTLFLDQIAEATITVSNSSAAAGFGASQVQFVTPTGTNEWHGSAYWYNRDRLLSSNFWQGNQFGSQRPPLHQNQGGVTIGLPLRRDRLFVYGNWESVRVREAIPVNRTILTSDARAGIFTYEDQDGNIRKPNLLQLAGVTMDPAIRSVLERVPGPDRINNFQIGDSRESVLKNTAGYLFNGGVWSDTDTALGRVDLLLSQSNSISGSYLWNRGSGGRPHNSAGYSVEPIAGARTRYKVSTLAWRWSAGPRFTNELRGGVNVSSAGSKNPDFQGRYLLQGTVFSNPALPGANNWRDTDTFTLSDGATYVRGVHTLRIGAETRIVRSRLTNDFGTIPTYTLGIGLGNPGLTVEQLPGARTPDVSLANNLLATLAGYVTSYSQSFNVTDRLSGFVPGAPNLRRLRLGSHAAYLTHQWKAMRGLTLNLGVRYEYHSPMDETNGLVLLPKVQAAGAAATLLSNATLDFAGGSTGRSLYAPDRNNFSPHAGVAYDLFGNGRTAFRAAYGVHYVNDESIFAVFLTRNEGLEAFSARQGVSARLTAGLPAIPAPVFRIPRTAEDNYRGNQGAALAMPDPALRTPYVQQWTLGIQHQVAGNVIEARYMGNHVSKAWRKVDYNQIEIVENGFLADFQRARNNGRLALAATGVFDPSYTSSIAGSQPLPVFSRLVNGGNLSQATVRTLIEQGQAGQLASQYRLSGGPVTFVPNQFTHAAYLLANASSSDYHALQLELRRRTRRGAQLQANYTFSKSLSDAAGTDPAHDEPYLDFNNRTIERSRTPFDFTHVIRANSVVDLPFGKGRKLNWRRIERLLSGWTTGTILTWQSGAPFSILSGRGTFNTFDRSRFTNTATSVLTKPELDRIFGLRQTGNGPYFIAASAIGPDGRAVADERRPPFSGQVFFHPDAGTVGSLQRRMFSGPWTFNLDASLVKSTIIAERHRLELRLDASNVLNHPVWSIGDQQLDSPNFGKAGAGGRRVVQVGVIYRW